MNKVSYSKKSLIWSILLASLLTVQVGLSHTPISLTLNNRSIALDYFKTTNDAHHLAYMGLRVQSISQHFLGRYDDVSLSSGIGFRQEISPTQIVGAYAFLDSGFNMAHWGEEIGAFTYFSNLNLGLEWDIGVWRMGINAYLPVSSEISDFKRAYAKSSSTPLPKSLEVIFGHKEIFKDHLPYEGHQQMMQTYTEEGSYGCDFKITHTFSQGGSVSGGLYYFRDKEANDLLGGAISLEYAFNRFFGGFAKGIYDKRGGVLIAGIKLNVWDGRDPTITEDPYHRLWRPLGRHLAPVMLKNVAVLQQNIYFFKDATGIETEATFETPSGVFNQKIVNEAHPNSSFYLDGAATYSFEAITLKPGQRILGRSDGFTEPAILSERPVLVGSLHLGGNSLENIELHHKIPQVEVAGGIMNASAITVDHAPVDINKTRIISEQRLDEQKNLRGISVLGSTLSIKESEIGIRNNNNGISKGVRLHAIYQNGNTSVSVDNTSFKLSTSSPHDQLGPFDFNSTGSKTLLIKNQCRFDLEGPTPEHLQKLLPKSNAAQNLKVDEPLSYRPMHTIHTHKGCGEKWFSWYPPFIPEETTVKPSNIDLFDAYQFFKKPANSSDTEIRKAYKALALKYHPDKNQEKNSSEKMMQLNKHWNTICQQRGM